MPINKLFKFHKNLFFLLLVSFLILPTVAIATSVQINGVVILPYKGKFFSKVPSGAEKSEAMREAKIQAWGLYTAKFSAAKMNQYLQVKDQFINNIDNYVHNLRVLDEIVDKQNKTISLTVRGTVNETAVDAVFGSLSAAGQQGTGEGSNFTFIFVSRQVVSAKTKDAKKIEIAQAQTASTANEAMAASGSAMTASSDTNSVTKKTTGGSTEISATSRQYEVMSSQDINASMGGILSTAGFEIIDYDDVVSYCGGAERTDIAEEFKLNDDMSRNSRISAINASKDCDVSLFATGTLDVGVQDIDPTTGQKRVYVSVRGQVWNIGHKLPKRVASVGPVQYSGLGPDDSVAMRNALNFAAEEAAKFIVEQLNAKNIN
jgi:hypothetical protein